MVALLNSFLGEDPIEINGIYFRIINTVKIKQLLDALNDNYVM